MAEKIMQTTNIQDADRRLQKTINLHRAYFAEWRNERFLKDKAPVHQHSKEIKEKDD